MKRRTATRLRCELPPEEDAFFAAPPCDCSERLRELLDVDARLRSVEERLYAVELRADATAIVVGETVH